MSNSTYVFRNYRPADFDNYVQLYTEAEKLEPTGRRISPQALRERLEKPNYSPEKDMFIIETGEKIVGFSDVIPELNIGRVILDCLVHPEHRKRGLARKLLGYALRRAGELKSKIAHVNIREDNSVARSVLSRMGFRVVRRFLELRLQLDQTRLSDTNHDTHRCRHLQHGEEDILTQIQNRCFAGTWGYNPNTTEEIAYRLNMSHCGPEDVILIFDGDKPVGYCWTMIDNEAEAATGDRRGYIHMLGVDRELRGREIGRIALHDGLSYLKNKGAQVVELTVDSENKVACALYRSAGFKTWAGNLWYEKAID